MEKLTRRSRRLVALLLVALFLMPTAKVRGQTLLHSVGNPGPEGTGFGQTVASLGDVDNDGAPDFAVGAPFTAGGQGEVLVVSKGIVLFRLTSPDPASFGSFGWAVTGLGDVNGDGIPDVAVGAPNQSVGTSFGRVFIFSGAPASDGSAMLLGVVDNPAPSGEGWFGYTLATVRDLDGNGIRELVVGAPLQNVLVQQGDGSVTERQAQGQVFILSLSASGGSGVLRVLDEPATAAQDFAFFGGALATGDVTGDDIDDIAVGAPEQSGGRGQVFVYSGREGDAVQVLNLPNSATPQFRPVFGDALAVVGDVNSDGLADLAVGAPGQSVTVQRKVGGQLIDQRFVGAGRVFIFSGASAVVTVDNPGLLDPELNTHTAFGKSLAAVGDFDADGVPDLAVGARNQNIVSGTLQDFGQGQAFIFSGATGQLRVTLPDQGEGDVVQTNPNSAYGTLVVLVENADRAGERYLVVSAPGQNIASGSTGQVFVYAMPPAVDTPAPTPRDETPPELIVPTTHVVVEATSPAGAVVSYPITASDDTDGPLVPVCSPPSGLFPISSFPVSCAATDRAGNSTSATFQVTVRDSTPPETVILSAVDGQKGPVSNGGSTVSSGITVKFGGSDAVGVESYYCSFDGGPSSPCTSPLSRSGLSAGSHVFAVGARDGARFSDQSPATLTWTILTKAQAAKQLKNAVKDLELSRREHAKLMSLLREIKERVSNRKRSDDKRACDELDTFLKRLASKEQARVITSAEVAPLRHLAQSLRVNIGCHSKHWHAGHRHR